MKRKAAILVFDEAEVLDFAGPFEVFAITSELNDDDHFEVALVGARREPVRAVNGLQVLPNRDFAEWPHPEILVISGGAGSRAAMRDPAVLAWVAGAVEKAEVVLSICSGARILAALGLLAGREFSTHHQVYEHVLEIEPTAIPRREARFTDTGRIITTGGISAGIDGAFHVVARLLGPEMAMRTARYMEYDWTPVMDYPGLAPG